MKRKYSSTKAGEFWSKRLDSTNPLSAVLTYNAPKVLNEVYDRWEIDNLVSVLPKSLKSKTALDIGCGTGRIALTMARLGGQVTAIDISRGMLKDLEMSARKENLVQRLRTIRSSSHELPFDNGAFEIVTCFGLLEHLPDDERLQTMMEAFRVVNANGKLYVVVNNECCVFLEDSYTLKTQRKDGYFATLVGLKWLQDVCRTNGKKAKVIAINPMYGLLHYYVSENRKRNFGRESTFANFVKLASIFDKTFSIGSAPLLTLSSHMMIEIK